MTAWQHNALADDLAAHLRTNGDRMVWTDMQLGPAGSPRPDVYSMPKAYARFAPLAYECKISVSDFRRDVVAGKWQPYLQYAAAVIFCVPAGLVTKADIPPGCGLLVRHETAWRSAKGPTLAAVTNLSRDAWMKLLIDGAGRAAVGMRKRDADGYSLARSARKKFGDRVGDLLQHEQSAESRLQDAIDALKERQANIEAETKALLEDAERKAAGILAEANATLRSLAAELGLPADAHRHTVIGELRRALEATNADGRVRAADYALDRAAEAIRRAKEQIPAMVREAAE